MTINMTISNYMIINYDYTTNCHVEIIDLVLHIIYIYINTFWVLQLIFMTMYQLKMTFAINDY